MRVQSRRGETGATVQANLPEGNVHGAWRDGQIHGGIQEVGPADQQRGSARYSAKESGRWPGFAALEFTGAGRHLFLLRVLLRAVENTENDAESREPLGDEFLCRCG